MIEAYPLCWPSDYRRTPGNSIKRSRFKTTLAQARDYVNAEIDRLGGRQSIVSTNIPLKQNGDMYADWNRFKITDHGVAVYFMYNGKQVCLCCDTYEKIWENMHAVGRTIAALRQINRDGVSDFLNRTFTGFKAIEAPTDTWAELEISQTKDKEVIKKAFWKKAAIVHPDKATGSTDAFKRLQGAYNDALLYAGEL